jgi:hypothetical protein
MMLPDQRDASTPTPGLPLVSILLIAAPCGWPALAGGGIVLPEMMEPGPLTDMSLGWTLGANKSVSNH